jgi:nucleotide-binding universal stress UspA family protein
MAIRKLLLPLTGTAAGEAALATSLMIARQWNAHVTALHVRVDSRDVAPLAGEGLSGAMFDSGRPVLISPRTAPATIGTRLCLGWNGTAESASAVYAALPWLQRADAVRILSAEGYQRRGPAAPELAAYLALHDVHADIHMFQSVGNSVGAGLLAAARDFGCDLLAMGAYSHSRLRQLILGGVTRHVLENAGIPVMMNR